MDVLLMYILLTIKGFSDAIRNKYVLHNLFIQPIPQPIHHLSSPTYFGLACNETHCRIYDKVLLYLTEMCTR